MRWNSLAVRTFRAIAPSRMMAGLMSCGLLITAAGCQIPALRGAESGPVLPSDFRGKAEAANSANIGIDEFFSDPTLTQLIHDGFASNQELKIRNQEVQIASNEILSRRGAYLPFVSLGASGGLDKPSLYTPLGAAEDQLTYPGGGRFPDPLPNTRLSANLFWQIDIWRELRNARDAAMQRYCETVEARNYFVTTLVAEIADNYYELAALDKQLVFLNQTIELQEQSLEVAKAQKAAARGTELGVQRFLAEVRKNESQRLIVQQQIIEVENRINFLVGRYPQFVDRVGWDFISLDSTPLNVGVPAQLLSNRRDIRAAERELAAAGLDILVARAHFYPRLDISANIGFEAFNPKYLFDPEAFIAGVAGDLVAPLINKKAIQAEYMNANARQLQAVYEYQRTILNAFTEVVNSMSKVENYRQSVQIKQEQVHALEESVRVASDLFQSARAEYVDVLFSQRDLLEARTNLIETKQQQLSAIVKAYQALGGGYLISNSGHGFADLYCPNMELQPNGVPCPVAPGYQMLSTTPGEATLPPSPVEAGMPPAADADEPTPVPDDAAPQPAPEAAAAPMPATWTPTPATARAGSSPPPPPDSADPPDADSGKASL